MEEIPKQMEKLNNDNFKKRTLYKKEIKKS